MASGRDAAANQLQEWYKKNKVTTTFVFLYTYLKIRYA